MSLAPYDAVVLLSFGGPERADDVLPFLRRVTAGRGIPDERLEVVGQHYYTLGGCSPVNEQGRALREALHAELASRGLDVPVHFGNRNWAPELVDALRDAAVGGAGRVLVVTTSAYASYSSCRQYRENLADAVAAAGADLPDGFAVDKVRPYWNAPAFADVVTAHTLDAVRDAQARGALDGTRIVYVTHSIPDAMAATSGSPDDRGAYVRDHEALAAHVSAAVAREVGRDVPADLVYCSRSGRPQDPWLEPDVNDHLRAVAADGAASVVVVPLGFLSDHMEVVWDLDHEAAATAAEVGLTMTRVPTVGTDPRFVAGLADLVVERAAEARGEAVDPLVRLGAPRPSVCARDCCPNPRGERPALCGR